MHIKHPLHALLKDKAASAGTDGRPHSPEQLLTFSVGENLLLSNNPSLSCSPLTPLHVTTTVGMRVG